MENDSDITYTLDTVKSKKNRRDVLDLFKKTDRTLLNRGISVCTTCLFVILSFTKEEGESRHPTILKRNECIVRYTNQHTVS